jgi:hypothetical protein
VIVDLGSMASIDHDALGVLVDADHHLRARQAAHRTAQREVLQTVHPNCTPPAGAGQRRFHKHGSCWI